MHVERLGHDAIVPCGVRLRVPTGWWRGLGLLPLFTVVFSLWAFAVVSWRVWQRYDRRMRRLEEERA